ncbi:hypothetical protein VNO77_39012 [Canavalia gladiata]|uniref:Uncharacterized protein n=1 Tax=Canavalia gladiata TaxID=3824 RepID=A0AAN9K9N2_CANGL
MNGVKLPDDLVVEFFTAPSGVLVEELEQTLSHVFNLQVIIRIWLAYIWSGWNQVYPSKFDISRSYSACLSRYIVTSGTGGEVTMHGFLKQDVPGWLHYATIRVIMVLPSPYYAWNVGAEGKMLSLNIVFGMETIISNHNWVGGLRWDVGIGVFVSYFTAASWAPDSQDRSASFDLGGKGDIAEFCASFIYPEDAKNRAPSRNERDVTKVIPKGLRGLKRRTPNHYAKNNGILIFPHAKVPSNS